MRRRKRTKRHYFTKVHEDAIVRYVASEDQAERTELYEQYIGPAFSEMVDKIIYTYKFTTLPNIESLGEECKIWLTTILGKYDPNKGSKAFSYFSVITKNWFIHKVKKNSAANKKNVDFENVNKEMEYKYLATFNEYENRREVDEFWECLWEEIDTWETGKMKPNEKKVLEAVRILL